MRFSGTAILVMDHRLEKKMADELELYYTAQPFGKFMKVRQYECSLPLTCLWKMLIAGRLMRTARPTTDPAVVLGAAWSSHPESTMQREIEKSGRV